MKRRVLYPIALLLSLFLLTSCGESPQTAPAVDMGDLQNVLLEADPTLPDMLSITGDVADAEALFAYVSDLPYEQVDDFLLSYSSEGKADELVVIAVKDPADLAAAEASLQAHLDQRLALFRQYTPDQAARAEKAILGTNERYQYAYLFICDENQAVLDTFETYLASDNL